MSEEEKQVAEAIPAAAEEKTVERDLVINSHASEVDIALLEDNILVELHREKTNNQFAVGDVYLGRVKKLLPSFESSSGRPNKALSGKVTCVVQPSIVRLLLSLLEPYTRLITTLPPRNWGVARKVTSATAAESGG